MNLISTHKSLFSKQNRNQTIEECALNERKHTTKFGPRGEFVHDFLCFGNDTPLTIFQIKTITILEKLKRVDHNDR